MDAVATANRIERLESRLSRLHLAMVAMVLTGVCALVLGLSQNTGANDERVIRARRFVLVDDEGRERAVLGFKEKSAGLFVLARNPRESPDEMIFVGVKDDRGKPLQYGRIEIGDQLFPKKHATLNSDYMGLNDEENGWNVGVSFHLSHAAFEFRDKSGLPFIELSHNEKAGSRLGMRTPLGMEDALSELQKAELEGKEGDRRIESAYSNSLRIELAVPPFSDPTMRLGKDGKVIWSAK